MQESTHYSLDMLASEVYGSKKPLIRVYLDYEE